MKLSTISERQSAEAASLTRSLVQPLAYTLVTMRRVHSRVSLLVGAVRNATRALPPVRPNNRGPAARCW